jgi:hypothetical protein
VERAFDELTFGAERTLNLRAHLPTRSEAVTRAESWLRERQMTMGGEVLVVTGRGNMSVDGVSVVREGIIQLLASLRRRNVITGYREHTAGSLVVELAPVSALLDAPRRRREPVGPPPPNPTTLAGLDPETRKLLRDLATIAMQHLGVNSPTRQIVEDEMLRQFSALSGGVPVGPDREAQLQQAIVRALQELEG